MQARIRRLNADHKNVSELLREHSQVSLLETSGDPPDRYVLEYRVPCLRFDKALGSPVAQDLQKVEIFLPLDYPRRPPFARMLTPVFHPNIDPQKICIGDHWSAGQSLSSLLLQIAEMLCYQSYNVKSPLNPEAAVWVETNLERLPLFNADLRSHSNP